MACNSNNSYVADAGDHYELVVDGVLKESVWYNASNQEAALSQAENRYNELCAASGGGGNGGGNPYAGIIAHVVYAGGGLCQFVLTYPDGRNVSNSPTDCFDAQGLYFWAVARGATPGRFEAPPLPAEPIYTPAPAPAPVQAPAPVAVNGGPQPAPVYQQVSYQQSSPTTSTITSIERFLGIGDGSPSTGGAAGSEPASKVASVLPLLLIVAGVVVLIMMKR